MIFKLAINNSSITQSFFTTSLLPITVEPSQIVDVAQIHGNTSAAFQPINSFLDFLRKKKIRRFYIQRTHGMGDILMLVPAVRELRKRGYDPYLWTVEWARPMLNLFDIESETVEQDFHPEENEYGIAMDMIVEGDHYHSELQVMHRCDIFFEALGIERTSRKLDWSLNFKKLPDLGMKGDYICFQGAGAHKMRQLSSESINYIAHKFKEKGINVILIDGDNRMPIKTLFALIAGAKCLVTMDSGPLWVSHFTQTPTIGLLGATRPSEKMAYHPLWPKRAVAIRLNEYLNPPCESCFGERKRCNDRVDCMRILPDQIFDLIYSRISKWL